MWCKVNQVERADLAGKRKISLEVVASAELGDIPSLAKRVPKPHRGRFVAKPLQIVGDIERSILQECSKTMKSRDLGI
jgi:hypothetical protein